MIYIDSKRGQRFARAQEDLYRCNKIKTDSEAYAQAYHEWQLAALDLGKELHDGNHHTAQGD